MPSPPRLLGALGLLFLGVRLHVSVRLGSQREELAWGEAGLLLALALAPPSWVVLLTPVAVVANFVQRRFPPVKILFNVASNTVAAAAAAAVLAACDAARPFAGPEFASLAAAGAVAGLVTYLAVAAVIAVVQQVPLLATWRASGGLQALTLASNIGLALGVLVLLEYQPWAVAALPVVALCLHQGNEGRLRGRQEREAGRRHAAAVGRLTRDLDEAGVLRRGAEDACDLADADVVDVELPARDAEPPVLHRHSRRGETWTGRPSGAPALPAQVVAEFPVYLGEDVAPGRLRVWLANPAPDLRLGEGEKPALKSLADHLGAAIVNARLHARQTYHATHDRVTGLPVRQLVVERVERSLRAGELGSHCPVALIRVDLLGFRTLGRTFGDVVAEDILVLTARRLEAAAQDGEYVGYVSADDFAVYLPDAVDPTYARTRAQQLVAAVATPMPLGRGEIVLEAAAGVAYSPTPVGSGTELLRQTAVALDLAHDAGRPVEFYDPAKDDVGSPAAVVMRSELHVALDEDQLFLQYQPIIDLPSAAPVAMEALARWNHPTKGLLYAADFITVLENSPDHDRFVAWQLDQALRTRTRWAADRDLAVSINLAARCLLDRRFPDRVAAALDRAGVPGDQLMLEIDEDAVLTGSMGSVEAILTDLQELGVRIAIDGFGAGDARLFGLLQVPADYLKIDGFYVREMFRSPQAMAAVCIGLDVARRIDLHVIAAGAASEEHVTRLSQLGCHLAQGPHLMPPLMPDAIAGYLTDAPIAPKPPEHAVVALDSRRRTPTP
jgi:predicted signal transduction protein with EAL and GGDEF domain